MPDSPPKMTSTTARVGSCEAKPSSPVCARGVVTTMLPAMSPYHLYSHQLPVGWLLTVSPLTVPYSYQNARCALSTPPRSNLAM